MAAKTHLKVNRHLRAVGLALLVAGVTVFTLLPFAGRYSFEADTVKSSIDQSVYSAIGEQLDKALEGRSFSSPLQVTAQVAEVLEVYNRDRQSAGERDKVIYTSEHDISTQLCKAVHTGWLSEQPTVLWLLTFGIALLGGLLMIVGNGWHAMTTGIKNNGVYHQASTSRGWVAWIVFPWLVVFYLVLYFRPELTVPLTAITDPISQALSGREGGRWFLYGFIYTTVMTVMAVRMFLKYKGNRYQTVRTASVLFFQICFAFLIPEVMGRMGLPAQDFKNIWPLDYTFFFSWRLDAMLAEGTLGIFLLVWGILLFVVGVPVMVYFFGKRWYCSWVCGCGGLAETLGDPYRQLSDKSIGAWKIERYLIHAVLVFAFAMTGMTLYTYFSGASQVFFLDTWKLQSAYGFLIGSVFAGVIGTGFYPVMGSRVWCRFGCPLAAYLGFVQRFKSRFRITTNGGQCISCGNCSTYCEMGIDVRWYAQRGQNIVRSSCVGCGVCAAVCPRGVLKLENGSETGRINANPILIGREGVQLSPDLLSNQRTMNG